LSLSAAQDVEAALRRYEEVRRRRTTRFIKAGPRIARLTTTRNPLLQIVRSQALQWIPEWALAQSLGSLANDPHRPLRSPPA
jgi:2-polyprenyl-6-methoxyphenol hydroxylase-like FAD-dependent oxidoreductase